MDGEDLELLIAKGVEAADGGVVVEIGEHDGQAALEMAAGEGLHAVGQVSGAGGFETFQEIEQAKDFPFAARGQLLGGAAGKALVERNDENAIQARQTEVANG